MVRSDTFLGVPSFSLSATSSHGRRDKKAESPSQAKLHVSVRRSRPNLWAPSRKVPAVALHQPPAVLTHSSHLTINHQREPQQHHGHQIMAMAASTPTPAVWSGCSDHDCRRAPAPTKTGANDRCKNFPRSSAITKLSPPADLIGAKF